MKNKPLILILEDDEITQLVYMGMFSKSPDFDIVLCKNDKELYVALEKQHFDLFLVDLGLSKSKDGLQIIKELRQMDLYTNTPIIVVSAYTMLQDEQECMAAGANKFIRKPFEMNHLRSEIKKLMDSKPS
ncbi:MAG: response regulator [Melioribacteraceae bacterium]